LTLLAYCVNIPVKKPEAYVSEESAFVCRFDPKVGDVIGGLTLLNIGSMKKANGHFESIYVCRCTCGEQVGLARYQLRQRTMCFTCSELERRRKIAKHGLFSAPGYHSWQKINSRCLRPNDRAYPRYGGRGITVCERWHRDNPDGLKNFLEDMGPKPGKNFSVDRIDNDKGYEPTNCRWATPKTQSDNRRNTIRIAIDGTTKTLSEWATLAGIKRAALLARYQGGTRGADLLKPTRAAGPRYITVNGETKQLHEWAAVSGVSANTIKLRLDSKNPPPPHDAVFMPSQRGRQLNGLMLHQDRKDSNMITALGKTRNVAAWARETGLSEGCLRYRVRQGWDHERVVTEGSNKAPLTINGETKSIREWAAVSGLDRNTIANRIAQGLEGTNLIASPIKGKPWTIRALEGDSKNTCEG
jgi:hypothetical protein